MWQLIINSPDKEPILVEIQPGVFSIGRASTNNIAIEDAAASRRHAEIHFNPSTDTLLIKDLDSTNGTYVNRQRLVGAMQLSADDLIRIGQIVFHVNRTATGLKRQPGISGTHRFTRELVLEALDEHSVLLYEISKKLNTVLEASDAVGEVTRLLRRIMGVDYCQVLLKEELKKLETSELADPLAKQALRTGSAEVTPTFMFVPIMNGEEVLGLISMHKSRPDTRPFDRRDLQLAVAISHQTALTILRLDLLAKVRREEQARRLLLRFVSPTEVEFLIKGYLNTGELPGLQEEKITVLFSDIANSTGMAEQLGTKHFASILNNFYQESSDIIFRYHGMIKYLGDGILGIFPEHENSAPPEERAVKAARELILGVNRTGSLDPTQRIVIGVSINTGPAMVGYVGTKERAEFTALGDVVNVAYRMQDYARPYKIIVGPATVAAVTTNYTFRRVGAVALKGREGTVQAYEVLP